MIIVCPDCDASFFVKASMIGRDGRRVRCGKCKSVWFKEGDLESIKKEEKAGVNTDEQLVDKIPDISNVPAINKKSGSFFVKSVVVFTMTGLIFITAILSSKTVLHNVPQLSEYYSKIGIFDNSGVALYAVDIDKNIEGKLIVSGSIKNDSKNEKRLPLLQLSFFADNGKKLQTKELFFDDKNLKSGEIYAFNEQIANFPKNSSKVVVDIGDKLDLFMR